MLAFVDLVLDLWRIPVGAVYGDEIEARAPPGIECGVGPVRQAVGAHAPGNASMLAITWSTMACGQLAVSSHCRSEAPSAPPLPGYMYRQDLWAAWSWEVLIPSCCGSALGACPPLGGSG